MAREPDARIQEAKALFDSGAKLVEIAKQFEISEGTVRSWKSRYGWGAESSATLRKKKRNVARAKGGQPGNQNAVGNSGGAAPPGNKNAEKHGLFSKYLPAETLELVEAAGVMDPLDVLWDQITIQYAAIIRSQKIMYVKAQNGGDQQASFLQAQSRAMTTLNNMIRNYDELLHRCWDLATEEQRARIEKLRAETGRLTGEGTEIEDISELEAEVYGSKA